jgi:hypothetical protein
MIPSALLPAIVKAARVWRSSPGRPPVSGGPLPAAEDVVTASLRGLMLGEVVCAPGVERHDLLDAALKSALAAFSAQSPHLAGRYRS